MLVNSQEWVLEWKQEVGKEAPHISSYTGWMASHLYSDRVQNNKHLDSQEKVQIYAEINRFLIFLQGIDQSRKVF